MKLWRRFLAAVLAVVLQSPIPIGYLAAQQNDNPAIKVTVTPPRTWTFGSDEVTFDTRFPRARLNDCEMTGDGAFTLWISPENKPINHSPWFAFKVSAARPRKITVHLRCAEGSIRYRPKLSTDGRRWIALPAEAFQLSQRPQANQGVLTLEIGPQPLFVAAQEFVSREELEDWGRTLEQLPFVTRGEIGRSIRGAPLYKLEIGEASSNPAYIVVIGRQHPPEVTGSLALMRFMEEIVGDSDLARSFRREFNILLVPLVNPDGVDLGHWRHNMGGVDLNRDWGTFAQPETRAVRDQILALKDKGRVLLHLDFHSTFNDVFYTQIDSPQSPDNFTKPWLDGITRRFPDYQVKRSPSEPTRLTTSTSWAYKTLGIPAITYELGDNTDRALLQQIATGAAQEMMTILLAQKAAAP